MSDTITSNAPPPVSGGAIVGEELPDTSMVWRRWIAIGVLAVGHFIVFWISQRITDAHLLRWIVGAVLLFSLIIAMTYYTGASITDWVKVIQAVRTKRMLVENGQTEKVVSTGAAQ